MNKTFSRFRYLYVVSFYVLSFFVFTAHTALWRYVGGASTFFDGKVRIAKGDGDTIFAGGDSGVAFWSGSVWHFISRTPVERILYADSKLYVSGIFNAVNGCRAKNIAVWNGNTWSALGEGIVVKSGIRVMAAGPDRSLYVGGDLDSAGGLPAAFIARWDGVQWDTAGNGVIGSRVDAITSGKNGEMYVASGTKVFRKANSTWEDISPKIVSESSWRAEVNVLGVAPDGTLYAGGGMPWLNNQLEYSGLIRWNGVSWSCIKEIPIRVMDLGFSSTGKVFVICTDDFWYYNTSQNWLSVSYDVYSVRGDSVDTLLYSGTSETFSTVTGSVPQNPCSIVVSGDSTFQVACGRGVINHKNGNNVPLVSGIRCQGELRSIPSQFTSNRNGSFVYGRDVIYNGSLIGKLSFLNGTAWEKIDFGNSYINGMKALDDGSLILRGTFRDIPGISDSTGIYDSLHNDQGIRYHNKTWSSIHTWEFPNVVTDGSGNHYAYHSNSIFRWNGSTWDSIGVLKSNSKDFDSLPEVCAATCDKKGNLIVVGRFDAVTKGTVITNCNNGIIWNGTAWSPLGVPDSLCDHPAQRGKKIRSIAIANDGKIFLATYAPQEYSTDILGYSDSKWKRILQLGSNNDANEMVVDSSGRLYINTYIEKNEGSHVSVYDDTGWHTTISPVNISSVYSVTGMHILSDGSTLRCFVQENGGYRYVMDYLPDELPVKCTFRKPVTTGVDDIAITFQKSYIQINLSEAVQNTSFKVAIIDLYGRIYKKYASGKGVPSLRISLSDLASGIYQVVVTNNRTVRSRLLHNLQ